MNRWSCVVLLFAIMGFSPLAGAYWDEAWTARAKITLNPQGVSAAVDNIPVPVRLHSATSIFWTRMLTVPTFDLFLPMTRPN